MSDLRDYPVNFPFGATSSPYSASKPHHGEDRAAPFGTPVIVGGTTVGLVGSTGYSTGNHCHIDKNTGTYVNPSDWVNIKEGTVTFAGANGTAGNQVSVQANGATYRFLHLSSILVSVGDKIGEKKMDTAAGEQLFLTGLHHDAPDRAAAAQWNGRSPTDAIASLRNYAEWQQLSQRLQDYPRLVAENKKLKEELAAGSGEFVETKVYVKKG